MSFKDLTKEKVYAVVKNRYVTLSAVQGQVIVATLWSGTEFQWSETQTQEVWGVKVFKDFLIGNNSDTLFLIKSFCCFRLNR